MNQSENAEILKKLIALKEEKKRTQIKRQIIEEFSNEELEELSLIEASQNTLKKLIDLESELDKKIQEIFSANTNLEKDYTEYEQKISEQMIADFVLEEPDTDAISEEEKNAREEIPSEEPKEEVIIDEDGKIINVK